MIKMNTLKQSRGFSLVEVALFIAIAGIAFVTIIIIFSNISEQSVDGHIRTVMTSLATERMEYMRSIDFENCIGQDGVVESDIPSFSGYTRETSVSYLDEDLLEDIGPTDYVRIKVTVTHPEHLAVVINNLRTNH